MHEKRTEKESMQGGLGLEAVAAVGTGAPHECCEYGSFAAILSVPSVSDWTTKVC